MPFANGYSYRRIITIDRTKVTGGTNLSSFPALISGTYSYLATVANGGKAQNASGYDIILASDPGGATKLDHEIERYTATTGEVILWVRIPTLSISANTEIFLFYGNSSISTSQENAAGVWNANFKGVYHFAETSGNYKESTSNANHGTTVVATSRTATGKMGYCPEFDGVDDHIACGQSLITGDNTIEAWVFLDTATARPICQHSGVGETEATNVLYGLETDISRNLWAQWEYGAGTNEIVTSTATVSFATWTHVVGVRNATAKTVAWYRDGALIGTTAYTNNPTGGNDAGALLEIGARKSSAVWWDGKIDELRISNAVRTAGWIQTSYNSQNSPATFYAVGDEIEVGGAAVNTGILDRWADGLPAPVLFSSNSVNLGLFDRWADGLPAPVLYGSTGGAAYTQTLTDPLVVVDAIVRLPQKVLSEITTIVDTIVKSTQRAFAEVVTAVDTRINQAGKAFSEIVPLVDSLTAKITGKILAETVAVVDTIAKFTSRVFAEIIAIADTIGKLTQRALSEIVIIADALGRAAGKVFSETITLLDTIGRATTRALAETITMADTLARQAIKVLSEAITAVDTLLKQLVFIKLLIETVILADTLARTTLRALAEAVTIIDTALKYTVKSALQEIVTITDTVAKQMQRIFSDVVTAVDTLLKQLILTKLLTETITIVDTITRSITRAFAETIAIIDSLLRQLVLTKLLTEAITVLDTIGKTTTRIIAEIITFVDAIIRQTQRALAETVTVADTLVKSTSRAFQDAITVVDTLARATLKAAFQEAVVVADAIAKQAQKVIAHTITLADSTARAIGKLAQETIALAATIAKATIRTLTEPITLADLVAAAGVVIVSLGNFILRSIYLAGYALKALATSFILHQPPRDHTPRSN